MKARSEQEQRPQRRRDDCRDDLGDRGQVGVVVVLGGDEYPSTTYAIYDWRPVELVAFSWLARDLPWSARPVTRADGPTLRA
jgi:hypothetical protein